jgi:hypothetical protein
VGFDFGIPKLDLSHLCDIQRYGPSAEQTSELIEQTENVNSGIQVLADSSKKLEALTATLLKATTDVHEEIVVLATSSGKLETLTIRLNRLTYVLIALTALAVLGPVGIEIWKVEREVNAPVSPNVIQHLLPTAPQTPPLSPPPSHQ